MSGILGAALGLDLEMKVYRTDARRFRIDADKSNPQVARFT